MNRARRLLGYLKPHWKSLVGATACAGTVALLTASYAWMVKPIIDEIFIKNQWDLLYWIIPSIVGVGMTKGGFNYARSYLMRYAGNRAIAAIRKDLFQKLIRMPIGFFSHQRTGALMSLIVNDAGMIQQVIATVIRDLFQQSLTMISLMGVLFYLNWWLALVSIVVVPLSYYPMSRIGKRIRRIAHSGQEKIAELTTLLEETLSGVRLIKAFGSEPFEIDRFDRKNQEYFQKTMKTTRLSELVPGIMEGVGAVAAALIIGVGAHEVRMGRMTPGGFFSFLGASWLMYAPVRHLAATSTIVQQAIAAVDRIFWMLDQPSERVKDQGKRALHPVEREIAFEHLSFHYDGMDEAALREIDLTVKAGEVVALVGSSGSGKTTLMNLLLRFYDPTEGVIRIDGTDLRDVTLDSLRKQIGLVAQETILFDDTVARNIAYGLESVDRNRVIEAAQAAYAHEFIQRLPQGYDTMIGERGVRLSGGQRQRLAVARAILRNSPILILDEATSSLDSESEMYIQKAMANLLKNRTTFVIAHRLSTVQNATRIVVIQQGRIVETGRHAELLLRGGVYKKLYQLQFREQYAETL
ncbi:MAG TPA: ABC transporter transmembrane domain-containing protein [Nitrospiria bacterium]|nr:ABC transporter transmembrane domain-containing protein [Nitrospiria bacterium]